MRILKCVFTASVISLILCSCEKILTYGDSSANALTINAIACADTVFTVDVSKVYNYWEMAQLPALEYWQYEMKYPYEGEPAYAGDALIKDAQIMLTVNGTEQIPLKYDSNTANYKSDYVPKAGDKIKIMVESDGYKSAEASVHVPDVPEIEVISCEKKYSKIPNADIAEELQDFFSIDTVARIVLRITDPVSENNFYRLKVRSGGMYYSSGEGYTYVANDVFYSDDILFRDDQLDKGYRGWPAYFSNIFTDVLFNGKDYEFTVESRLRSSNYKTPYIIVELQSITQELFYYLKSTMLYRIIDQDTYTEPIIINSNVEGGLGVLGGVNSHRHVIYL